MDYCVKLKINNDSVYIFIFTKGVGGSYKNGETKNLSESRLSKR
jgi:hypothetical protein